MRTLIGNRLYQSRHAYIHISKIAATLFTPFLCRGAHALGASEH